MPARFGWAKWRQSIYACWQDQAGTGADEVAIKCDLQVPEALFERPALSARIAVPDEAVPSTEINMELASNIQDLVQQHLGLTLQVGVEEPERDDG